MNIDEVRISKARLEHSIAELMNEFSAETGMTVVSIEGDYRFLQLGVPLNYVVRVEVTL